MTAGRRLQSPAVDVDKECFDRVLIRMTKGFLATHHPEYHYHEDDFTCGYIPPIDEEIIKYATAFQLLPRRSIGSDIFIYWGGITIERNGGLWVYLFYDNALFGVAHKSPHAKYPEAD